jgi:hypothetical protein
MLNCGDTFLAADTEEEQLHLWIVVTPPSAGEVVTVCLVTAHKRSERLVVLNEGDHPFVQHESVIAYGYSKIRAVADIEELLRKKLAKQREPASPQLLAKIQAGLLDSEFTPNGVLAYYKGVMGEDRGRGRIP